MDVRDFRSSLPSLLYAGGFTVIPRTLLVGDFIVSTEICIERKGKAYEREWECIVYIVWIIVYKYDTQSNISFINLFLIDWPGIGLVEK